MVRNRIVRNPLWERKTERFAFLECSEKFVDPRLADAELLCNLTP